MKFNFQFSNLCGVAYKGGNVVFSPDGNSVVSPVGNRVTVFDLVNHKSTTMPFEARRNIRRIELSHDGKLLVVVDTEGRGLLVNFLARTVLHRFNFKAKVRALAFSPDDRFLAVAVGRKVQVWHAPSARKEFSPLALHRTFVGHHNDVISIAWSPDSRYFVTGSRDMTARIYALRTERDFAVVTLTGHKDVVLGVFFMMDQALATSVKDEDEHGEDPALSMLDMASTHVIYSVAADGALIVWRWEWTSSNTPGEAEGDDEESSGGDEPEDGKRSPALSISHGQWKRHARYFLQKDHARINSVAMHAKRKDLLVVGFDNGVFSLYEMPSATHIQSLSVSQHDLRTTAVNCTGEWLALGSSQLGQLLVWEWQSETYVLKQQGHFFDLNVVAYSPDGQLVATGGDDAKVKLWSTTSGFCFVTFSEHEAPVTALAFLGEGNAVLSASLDGTVRAFDLVRYRNFRTMKTPTPVQLTCLAVDGQGEVVCAGAMDPAEIYVWSLQTGKLLDVLAGHEGPVASISFNPGRPMLASTSWDQTLRLWEPYQSTSPKETFNLQSDGLHVTFRPDGKEVCVSTLNGQLSFWDVDNGQQRSLIEGRRDISGGRRIADRMTADNAAHSKHFTTVCYTADGSCVIAGGRSKFVCIYQVEQRILLKKYQLSHNRSLDGVLDKLNSKRLTEAGPADDMDVSDHSDSEDEAVVGRAKALALPGASRGDLGKRTTRAEIRCKSVQFSPTGQEWAAATTDGLLIYALDSAMLFDPFNLDEDVTPEKIREQARQGESGRAMVLALHLGEADLITEVYRSVPQDSISLVARSIPVIYVQRVLELIAQQLSATPQIEHHLAWARALLTSHHDRLRSQAPQFMAAFRGLQKAISQHTKDLTSLCNDNVYALSFLSHRGAKRPFQILNPSDEATAEALKARRPTDKQEKEDGQQGRKHKLVKS